MKILIEFFGTSIKNACGFGFSVQAFAYGMETKGN